MSGQSSQTPLGPQQLLAQLDDIKGLLPIATWPPGPGWWALLVLAGVVFAAGGIYHARKRAWARSWKGDAMRALEALETALQEDNARDSAGALSGMLKRIAMKTHTRGACAGLEGGRWLRFLADNDPRGFDWAGQGTPLIEAPYAPPGTRFPVDSLKPLIAAAKEWVK
jgi:hypothetical protein